MKIYLACTVRGDRGGVLAGRAICERLQHHGHEVLTTHLLADNVEVAESALTEADVYRRDLDWLASCDVLVAEASGSSYGVGFAVEAASPGEVEIAARVADSVAAEHRLRTRLDYRKEMPVLLADESRELLEYGSTPARGKAEDGARSRIVLGVGTSRDGSEIRFVLQDLDRGSESPYFRRIQDDLARALAEAFAGRKIDAQRGRFAREAWGP